MTKKMRIIRMTSDIDEDEIGRADEDDETNDYSETDEGGKTHLIRRLLLGSPEGQS